MNRMAGHAGHGSLIPDFGFGNTPRPLGVHGCHQFPDVAVKMHAVAPQAVVHQLALAVMVLVGEDAPIRGAVRARFPLGELLLVTRTAALDESCDIGLPDARLFGYVALHMCRQPLGAAAEAVGVACAAFDASMAGAAPVLDERPDLVAACAEAGPGEHRSRR